MTYKSVGMQWFDPITKSYLSNFFDNYGNVGHGVTTKSGNTWTFMGTMIDSKGKSSKTKNTTTFSPDGQTFTVKGEISADDGKTWMPWWESIHKKVSKNAAAQKAYEQGLEFIKSSTASMPIYGGA